ncbi:MAG TPA: amino acid permease, partial [Pyrinomonadaceae bacterium]|nr:amino acid permease [Pyrinomonadaceae bacterium]
RDGLVPRGFFGDIHPKFRTPWKSTILTGLFVASMAGFIPLSILAEMTSIGTLFAFVIVCGAVIVMRRTHPNANRPFRAPLVPLIPILGILTCLLLMFSLPAENWYRLIIWLGIGLLIYFFYGRRHSVMALHLAHEIGTHGVSPAGQAVGDPDAPPDSPARPIDSRVGD